MHVSKAILIRDLDGASIGDQIVDCTYTHKQQNKQQNKPKQIDTTRWINASLASSSTVCTYFPQTHFEPQQR